MWVILKIAYFFYGKMNGRCSLSGVDLGCLEGRADSRLGGDVLIQHMKHAGTRASGAPSVPRTILKDRC